MYQLGSTRLKFTSVLTEKGYSLTEISKLTGHVMNKGIIFTYVFIVSIIFIACITHRFEKKIVDYVQACRIV